MRMSRRVLVVGLVWVTNFYLLSFAVAQQSDQVVAERVLSPRWKELSRRAGMIFAGTVLTTATQTVTAQTAATDRSVPSVVSAVQLSFRVDHPIAGVEQGQVLTIREWAGAWSMHRPMCRGQHILIFLYPPSRLGLTSPVGGPLGQVALDASGKNVAEHEPKSVAPIGSSCSRLPAAGGSVSVVQLERAIRSAREE